VRGQNEIQTSPSLLKVSWKQKRKHTIDLGEDSGKGMSEPEAGKSGGRGGSCGQSGMVSPKKT
jgi:hypothetical protein